MEHLSDIPDFRDDHTGEGDYPKGQGQNPLLSRDAEHSTYEPGYTPPTEPPAGPATWQTLNSATPS